MGRDIKRGKRFVSDYDSRTNRNDRRPNDDYDSEVHKRMRLPDDIGPSAIHLALQTPETMTGQSVNAPDFDEEQGIHRPSAYDRLYT